MRAAAASGCPEARPPSRIFMAHVVAADLLLARIYTSTPISERIDWNFKLNSDGQFIYERNSSTFAPIRHYLIAICKNCFTEFFMALSYCHHRSRIADLPSAICRGEPLIANARDFCVEDTAEKRRREKKSEKESEKQRD